MNALAENNIAQLPGSAIVKRQPKASLTIGDAPRAIVPTTIEQVWRLAELASKSGLAPRDMATTEKCAVAILHGLEVGLAPMQAIQRICVINGRPTIWGDAVLGLVRSSGLLESISEEIVPGEKGNLIAVCTVKRVGEKEAVTRKFSVENAKLAGLWNKRGREGQPTPWVTHPERMLQMRARAFALRDVFPDVTGGMYLREEIDESEMKDVTPRAEPPDPTPAPEPSAAPGEPPDPPASEPPKTIEATAVETFNVEQWLKDLEGAFGGCEDATSLADAVQKYMNPEKSKVSEADFARAGQLSAAAFTRITSNAPPF